MTAQRTINDHQKKIIDRHISLYTNGLVETLTIKCPDEIIKDIYSPEMFKVINPKRHNIENVLYDYYKLGIYPEIEEHP